MVPEHARRSFRALVAVQFLGAFNDNLFKQLILFLAARFLFPGQDLQGLAFMVFALPFVLFSGMAGQISECHSKRNVIVAMKVFEILIMALGLVALQLQNWPFLLSVLFIMGLQSTLFGPSKYGAIPELVPAPGLLQANGTIAMTTFMAVLVGQALAGPLLDEFSDRMWVSGAVCVLLAVLGTVLAVVMGPLPRQKPDLKLGYNPFAGLMSTILVLRRHQGLLLIVLLNSCFWFNAGVIQQSIVALGDPGYLAVGAGENWKLSVLMVTLALAIMGGSVVAPLVGRWMRAGPMAMIGAVGIFSGQLLMLFIGPVFSGDSQGYSFAIAVMVVIGFLGAFFVVPVQSFLQHAPPSGMKGQTFAVNNFMNFLFLVLAGAFYLAARELANLGPTLVQLLAGVLLMLVLAACRAPLTAMRIEADR